MKMKKILAALLGTATVFTLAACGDDEVKPDVTPPTEDKDEEVTPEVVLKPTLEIEVSTMELLYGTTLGDTLKNNIKSAKLDDGTDAKDKVVIDHTIKLTDDKISEAGSYTVKYSLTEGETKVEKILTVTVLAEDAIKLPTVDDLFFKPNGLSDNYLFDFDTTVKMAELQTLLDMTLEELQVNFQYKYEIYNIDNNEVIGEAVYKNIGGWQVALPTPSEFSPAINEYMTEKEIYELKFSGRVQIVKMEDCKLNVADGEPANVKVLSEKPSLSETFITVTKLAPDADVKISTPTNLVVNNLQTTWLIQFGWSPLVTQLANDLGITTAEVSENFDIKFVFTDDDTKEEIHTLVKALGASNATCNVRTTDMLSFIENYMEEVDVTSANIKVSLQIVQSENSTLTQNIIDSDIVTADSFGHTLPVVIGTPFNYTHFWEDQNKAYAELTQGDIGLFVNSSSDTLAGELNGDVLSVMGEQSESSTWWGLQLLGRMAVSQTGRYEAEYLISNSTVSGWITVQGQQYYVEEGKDLPIKVKLDLVANTDFKMEIMFGQNGRDGVNPTIGNFQMDIQLKGLVKNDSAKIRADYYTFKLPVGTDIKEIIDTNLVFAQYADGSDAMDDVSINVQEGLHGEDGLAATEGKFTVTYSIIEDDVTYSVTVTFTIVAE